MKPVSYFAAVSGNISDMVNTAVAKSICEQRIEDRGKASVSVHNMREHGNEVRNIQELAEFMDCSVLVVKAVRIGQMGKISKPYLLKVELQLSAV